MVRAIVSVIVGYALWTALWLGGNALLFPAVADAASKGERVDRPGPLVGLLALSVGCSLAAGAAAGALAGRGRPVLILAGLLLLTGVGVQASVWSRMPVWYHLPFLALLVPATLAGARLSARPAAR